MAVQKPTNVMNDFDEVFPPADTADADGWTEVGSGGDDWDFETNKTIIGLYITKRSNVGKNNSNIYVIQTKDGKNYSIWGSKVLDDSFDMIPTGHEVRIEYLGKEMSKGGNEFKNYSVRHRAPQA